MTAHSRLLAVASFLIATTSALAAPPAADTPPFNVPFAVNVSDKMDGTGDPTLEARLIALSLERSAQVCASVLGKDAQPTLIAHGKIGRGKAAGWMTSQYRCLLKIQDPSTLIRHAAYLLGVDSADFVAAATETLVRIGGVSAQPLIQSLLTATEADYGDLERQKKAEIDALVRLLIYGPYTDSIARGLILALNLEYGVSEYAARQMHHLYFKQIDVLLTQYLDDGMLDDAGFARAVEALEHRNPETLVRPTLDVIERANPMAFYDALTALAAMGSVPRDQADRALQLMQAILADLSRPSYEREHALTILGNIRLPLAIAPLEAAIQQVLALPAPLGALDAFRLVSAAEALMRTLRPTGGVQSNTVLRAAIPVLTQVAAMQADFGKHPYRAKQVLAALGVGQGS